MTKFFNSHGTGATYASRGLRQMLALIAALGVSTGACAQANADRVGPIISKTMSQGLCGPNAASAGSASQTCLTYQEINRLAETGALTPHQQNLLLSQFAPDKFVAFSASSFAGTGAQLRIVGDRLSELRDVNLGAGVFSTTATPAFALLESSNRGDVNSSSSAHAAETMDARTTDGNASTPAANSGQAAAPAAPLAPGGTGLYARLHGQGDTSRPTSFDPGFKTLATGLTLGADFLVAPNAAIGASISYENSRSTLTATGAGDGGGGELRSRTLNVALYGAWYPTATSYLDLTMVYGSSRYNSTRRININIDVPTPIHLVDTLVGSTSGHQSGVDFGGGCNFLSGHISFGPYARLALSRTVISGFSELPSGSGAELTLNSQAASSLTSKFGAQASYAVSETWGVLVPNARLEWEHQYKQDRSRSIVAAFAIDATDPPVPAVVDTTPPDHNYFDLGLGLAAHFGVGRSAFIYYQTALGKAEQSSNAVTAEIRLEF